MANLGGRRLATKDQLFTQLDFGQNPNRGQAQHRKNSRRANELDGATWTKYSLSVWSDIRKSPEEIALRHPAIFPVALVRRLIQCFTTLDDRMVLDPFSGSGATLIGAMLEGKTGVGFEIVPGYIKLSNDRIGRWHLPFEKQTNSEPRLYKEDARNLLRVIGPSSVPEVAPRVVET